MVRKVLKEHKVLLVVVVALVRKVHRELKARRARKAYKGLNHQDIMGKVAQLKILLLQ
jgi:hypothetical protein